MRTALRGLADTAAVVDGDPVDLWTAGRRRVRRRRLSMAGVAAALVVLLGSGALALAPVTVLESAAARHDPAVPRTVWQPLSFYAHAGPGDPPGSLAVVGSDLDGAGIFGVSATTGAYRLLDLPGRYRGAEAGLPVLSPAGTSLAYWITGTPSQEAYPDPATGQTPVGVAVLNLVTGELQRYRPPSAHGLAVGRLTWDDDTTLRIGALQRIAADGRTVGSTTAVWDTEGHQIPSVGLPITQPPTAFLISRDGGVLERVKPRVFARQDGVAGKVRLDIADPAAVHALAVSDAAAVVLVDDGAGGRTLASGAVRDGRVRSLGQLDLGDHFLGFADDRTGYVVGSQMVPGGAYEGFPLYRVDLLTAQATRIGTVPTTDIEVARSLLNRPLVDGVQPPEHGVLWSFAMTIPGTALLGAVGFAGVLAALAGLRRRRHGRG